MKNRGRPRSSPESLRVRIHVRLAPETIVMLDDLAEREGETRTGEIEKLVWEETERTILREWGRIKKKMSNP